ncbi:hypothetical protein EYF80_018933 [Liparis tanakae]|uniref:Uncharacterized protein n=1 Tax=Liparis tanakae TaxID=230148 RepID=A0A4Z2HY75_9TELE|nr:hypothetical protein EYF80_018933 [Liparis tanakae]
MEPPHALLHMHRASAQTSNCPRDASAAVGSGWFWLVLDCSTETNRSKAENTKTRLATHTRVEGTRARQLVRFSAVKVMITVSDFYLATRPLSRGPETPAQTLGQLDPGSGFTRSLQHGTAVWCRSMCLKSPKAAIWTDLTLGRKIKAPVRPHPGRQRVHPALPAASHRLTQRTPGGGSSSHGNQSQTWMLLPRCYRGQAKGVTSASVRDEVVRLV